MKRKRSLILGVQALALGLMASVASGQGTIVGSAHDFQAEGFSGGEICKPCHIPHNASSANGAPLWNHTLTDSAQTYDMYGGGSLARDLALDGDSVLCMSCHDGTVALDSFGGATDGTVFIGTIRATALLGTSLTNDHPVGAAAVYTVAGDAKFNSSASWEDTSIGYNLRTIGADNVVSCATCHDVHNLQGNTFLLRVSNSASALCRDCHIR